MREQFFTKHGTAVILIGILALAVILTSALLPTTLAKYTFTNTFDATIRVLQSEVDPSVASVDAQKASTEITSLILTDGNPANAFLYPLDGKTKQLDSTGLNYGVPLTNNYIRQAIGHTTVDFCYTISYYYLSGVHHLDVYYADTPINDLSAGEEVAEVYRTEYVYNTTTKQFDQNGGVYVGYMNVELSSTSGTTIVRFKADSYHGYVPVATA